MVQLEALAAVSWRHFQWDMFFIWTAGRQDRRYSCLNLDWFNSNGCINLGHGQFAVWIISCPLKGHCEEIAWVLQVILVLRLFRIRVVILVERHYLFLFNHIRSPGHASVTVAIRPLWLFVKITNISITTILETMGNLVPAGLLEALFVIIATFVAAEELCKIFHGVRESWSQVVNLL